MPICFMIASEDEVQQNNSINKNCKRDKI